MRRALRCFALILLLALPGGSSPLHAQDAPQDALLITPITRGRFDLPQTGAVVEIPYASVEAPTRLIVTREGAALRLTAASSGVPLETFATPLIVTPGADSIAAVVVSWPGEVRVPADPAEAWLIFFDAHGVYARPADPQATGTERTLHLGPLEHFRFGLLRGRPDAEGALALDGLHYRLSAPAARTIRVEQQGTAIASLPMAAHSPRYRMRFLPEDLRNPGGLLLLGWAQAADLPEIARALAGRLPDNPDIPAPGVPEAPLPLILPFDCGADWAVSWGYHHSTPQNRFAVDFAPVIAAGPQTVYATHAGTLAFKRTGSRAQYVDVGLVARVTAADGITSTVYGHLDPQTLARWGLAEVDLPEFAWVEAGSVAAGDPIGVMGRTGYATGPHIHFALWSWDQSVYQPVPLGPLRAFSRGLLIPAATRRDCDQYGRSG